MKPAKKAFSPSARGPLNGVRVVDLSRLVAGNILSLQFADFGAEVIKIEPPEGDTLRSWRVKGIETAWKVYSRNKKSVALDLRSDAGRAIVRALAASAQIVVESFRPGVLEDMGLAPAELHKLNPKLVIVRISGWGQDGRFRHKPGFGTLIEGYSGFASMNGFGDREPVLPPMYLADAMAALYGYGAVMVALGVPVTAHLTATALIVGVSVPAASRAFVPDRADGDATAGRAVARISALAAWREPRTLMIGVFVLAFAFAEGTGNDWISVAVIDDYHAPPAVGTLVFAVFLIAMTTGRWCGPPLLDRYGRVRVVRSLAVVAVAGLMLFVFGPSILAAFAGVLLWGAGTALGFPVGMSAGADDPGRAASRVSVIASVGYCAFLGGPPLIGFLADHNTVRTALIAVAVLLALATVTASAIRRPAGLPDSG